MKYLPTKLIALFAALLLSSHSFAEFSIKLIKAKSAGYSFYGTRSEHQYFDILVNRKINTEAVKLRLIDKDGNWQDLPAKKVTPINEHIERWQLDYQSCMRGTKLCSEDSQPPSINFIKFAIYADTATGQYWDNNQGQDYRLAKGEGWLLGEFLNVAANDAYPGSLYKQQQTFYPQILVRNLALAKQVQIIYSFDSWLTSHSTEASFQTYQIIGPKGGLVRNPSKHGVESWAVSIPVANKNQLAYFVRYKVEDQWYTDNNFGQHYQVTRRLQ